MALLIDTCALLAIDKFADKALSPQTLQRIEVEPVVYISTCSCFEISRKFKSGRLDLGKYSDALDYWEASVNRHQFVEVSISSLMFYQSVQLPEHHSDPFDRIIIAEAMRLKCPIVTYDKVFESYDVSLLS